MLVLTTMFINVSNNLPTTAYIKMIDIWLIFNLLIPFLLVLLHTYMDSLRTEAKDDGEERTINHHGKEIKVGADTSSHDISEVTTGKLIQVHPAPLEDRQAALVHRNEKLELEVSKCLHQNQYLFLSRLERHCTILSGIIRQARKKSN